MSSLAVPLPEAKPKRWIVWIGWAVSLWPVFVVVSSVVDPNSWTKKGLFLRGWTALKIEESQCLKPGRIIRPA